MRTGREYLIHTKNIVAAIMVLLIAIAFMPMTAFGASSTIKNKTYQVYKTGKTVYCAGAKGIYKVKVKKGKVKSKKLIYKSYGSYEGSNVFYLRKYKNYIYFVQGTEGTVSYLYRVKTNGKDKKRIVRGNEFGGYALKDDRLYYSLLTEPEDEDAEDYVETTYVANLDGSNRQKTDAEFIQKWKKTNKKGYAVKVKAVKKGKYFKDYLKTPKGKFYLGKIKNEFYY